MNWIFTVIIPSIFTGVIGNFIWSIIRRRKKTIKIKITIDS
jgi:LytS/YehU family sensor histidine kinase